MRGARTTHAVHNRLAAVLTGLGVTLGELVRRTMLPARTLARVRAPHANPPLRVAERIARALDVRVETLFVLAGSDLPHTSGATPTRTGLGPLLAERRLSDVQLAAAAALDRAHVNRLKNGRTLPSVGTALAIAAALDVDVASVFPAQDPRRATRRLGRRSVAVRRAGVGDAAVGSALVADHQRPAELHRER